MAALLAHMPGGRRTGTPERVLVIRLGNIGDIVVALPAFHALRTRFSNAHMTLLTSPTRRGAAGAREVLANDDTFDDMIVYYADESQKPAFLRNLKAQIHARQIDTAVLLPNHMASFTSIAKYIGLLASAGVRRIIGHQLVTPADYAVRQVDRLITLIHPLDITGVPPLPWLHAKPEEKAKADQFLGDFSGRPLVAMHCGATRPANRWPAAHFIELGQKLIQSGVDIVLTGTQGEKGLVDSVASALEPHSHNVAGQTTIGDLVAILQACRVLVTNDTGVMHVGYASGTPVIAIFSGRFYPNIWYPYGPNSHVLRNDIACSPCMAETCPLYDQPKCMTQINPDDVFNATKPYLGLDPL